MAELEGVVDFKSSVNPCGRWHCVRVSDVMEADPPADWGRPPRADLMAKLSVASTDTVKGQFSADTKPLTAVQPMPWWEEACAMLLLFLVPGAALWMPIVAIALLACAVAGWVAWTWLVGFLAALGAVWLLPCQFSAAAVSPRSWASRLLMKYFSFKVVYAHQLDPARQYVLAASPHGAFPVGNVLSVLASPACAGFSFRSLVASSALALPFYRQAFGRIGGVPASRAVASNVLASGTSLGLAPGGIAEMFMPDTASEVHVLLSSRSGFIRLAMQHGAALVPGFAFGNSDALGLWAPPFLQGVSRMLRASLIVMWGRFGLPIPFRAPVTAVMAKPILLHKTPDPTPEQVRAVHQLFIEHVVEAFNHHKAAYGWSNKNIVVA